MEYRGFFPTVAEFMVRFHARSYVYGAMVGSHALADPGPGTPEEKLNRALAALYAGGFDPPAVEAPPEPPALHAPPGEPARRKPGRPAKSPPDQSLTPGPNGGPSP